MDAATIISAVINQVGTDASRATVLSLLNEAYATQVVDARWYRTEASIGTTTAGDNSYTVPDAIVEAFYLKVGDYNYEPIGEDAMWKVQAGTLGARVPAGGLFAPGYDSDGNAIITIYPTPSTSGDTITVYAARIPSDLTDSASSSPITPSDTHGSLIDGTAALVLDRIDERPDLAAPFRLRFEQATEKLRRRKNARLRGGSPMQIQVAGKHF